MAGRRAALCVMLLWAAGAVGADGGAAGAEAIRATVEIEELVYTFRPADNGAGPLWSYGSTCIARLGDDVFISGLETLPDVKPVNNVRWLLFRRGRDGWRRIARGTGRTREPCPLACFPDGTLFLSDNPTLTGPEESHGPARPEILMFSAARPEAEPKTLLPVWDGSPDFSEHSYRSFAADGQRGELILFQNVGYTHAEWAFRDGEGRWSAQGKLEWPWGAEYPEPRHARVCYPTVALKDRAVYFCGVSDIEEPYPQWREYKRELTGQEWDYDFRRLFYTWSDDITAGRFHEWVEVSTRDETCGWLRPCDLWVDAAGTVHLLWTERAIDERLREKFFPGAKQSHALMYATLRDGAVLTKKALHLAEEGGPSIIASTGRFHVSADGRLYVFYHVRGEDESGQTVSENRIVEIEPDGQVSRPAVVPLKQPFTQFYTAAWRAGSPRSDLLDIYGTRAGEGDALAYARIRIGRETDAPGEP